MSKGIKSILVNFGISIASLLLFLLFFEFVVFRFFLPASDNPTPYFLNDVVRHTPGQEGVFRFKDEIEATFRINSNGWNSGHREYKTTKRPDIYRIAIIGDSYIEALQVDHNKSVAERLETKLGIDRFQVYRFGISGAPLSQYLHMLRKEVIQYVPNLVIINLVHNDFDESYKFQPGVYTSSFMKLEVLNNTVSTELAPQPFQPPWYHWIRESATWGYLAYRQRYNFNLLRKMILGNKKSKPKFQANIDVAKLENQIQTNQLVTNYLFQEMKKVCDSKKIKLLIIIDGERGGIYKNLSAKELDKNSALSLNAMAGFVAKQHQIDFLDLHDVFTKDYLKNTKPFNFDHDGHWNAYAHEVVAEELTKRIRKRYVTKD